MGEEPSVNQWVPVVVNRETFNGWRDTGTVKIIIMPHVLKSHQLLPECEMWVEMSWCKSLHTVYSSDFYTDPRRVKGAGCEGTVRYSIIFGFAKLYFGFDSRRGKTDQPGLVARD